jgi:hypothetical protein
MTSVLRRRLGRTRRLPETEQGRRPVAALRCGDLVVAGPPAAQRRVITDASHAERAGVHRLDVV